MDREAALERLPETHAAALRLRDCGGDNDAIASALGLDGQAVPSLLRIAEEKLAAVLASGEPGDERRT